MESPFTGKKMSIHQEWRTLSFRKDEFEILSHTYKCDKTGEKFEDDLFAKLNYNQLLNQYRAKYSIPFPEEIISIRKKYDVSALKMSEILGLGPNTYRQYENGEVPNQSNSRLIQLIDDPHEFKKLVDLCNTIDIRVKEKLYHKIELALDRQKKNKANSHLENFLFETCLPNIYTGYRIPSLPKFAEMVIYFVEKLQPWKTKLNKLLFYADFAMFKYSAYSISGAQYRAIPLGPVPKNFEGIFDYLARRDYITIQYTTFPDGGIGERFKLNSNRTFNFEMFTESELNVMEFIKERFKNVSTNEIIKLSHKEKAWRENNKGHQIINYNYGFDIKQVGLNERLQ